MAPLTRRRSARLASNSKVRTVSPHTPTGVAATPGLDSLAEQIEEQLSSPTAQQPQTPAHSSPAKPSKSEMRPGKANGAMAPPSSALRLGFTDIGDARQESPTTAKTNKIAASATLKAVSPEDNETPSKKRSPLSAISPFTFRFSRLKGKQPADATATDAASAASPKKVTGTPDLGLSDEARRMMEELREEAQKIRADLEVEREQEKAREEEDAASGRKIAKPKSRAGRYSAAHTAEFSKMDSIANHPSAFRASRYTPAKSTPSATATAATPAISSQARGLKRTQSKANLDETPHPKTTRSHAAPTPVGGSVSMSTKKAYNPLFDNNQSHGGIDSKPPQSARKGNLLFPLPNDSPQQPLSATKRIKQNIGDDASSSRPMSRDGSSLPRPAAALASSVSSISRSHTTASLLTPTKSFSLASGTSLGASTNMGTSATATATATATANTNGDVQPKTPSKTPSKAPSKTPLQLFSALKKSATTSSLQSSVRTPPAASTPTAAQAGKTTASKPKGPMFRAAGHLKKSAAATSSAVKVPSQANTGVTRSVPPVSTSFGPTATAFSKTPAPARLTDRVVPARVPMTTPRRKLVKHVAFTPGTQRAVMSEMSPSLFRSSIPRSALKSYTGGAHGSEMQIDGKDEPAAESPSMRRRFGTTVYYPDLSGHELLGEAAAASPGQEKVLSPPTALAPPVAPHSSVPGTFTFRSDKTINFGPTSPAGFGSSPGQASVRQVRHSTSVLPKIPGSFPGASQVGDMFTALVATEGTNKENTRPVAVSIIPHGITNKKRHRVSEAEEAEEEAAQRAAKKRKNAPVPEGEALLAPRLAGKTVPPTPSGRVIAGMRSSPHKMSPHKASPQKPTQQKMTPHKTVTFDAAAGTSKTPIAGKTQTPASASVKKRPILSMSRLNSLARPKLRK
ncbi:hypothetical protein SPBR_00178 [Sporothrix brasiliensis 5110]|uniref:Erythromycin esterase n=1 Tax=Sporothrix brasiliensis 5110 TaxID=1398154 RepID=A0A0C2J055_9PEZI|nr:uncharacterized protein SPBR_00178 [Sporothrix brasiliensis 5110]KIH90572.1 hypothetical protein SPBR_00178 [Sporothrix brasiliensis 5110]